MMEYFGFHNMPMIWVSSTLVSPWIWLSQNLVVLKFRKSLISGEHRCIWQLALQPNSLQTLPCVRWRRLKCGFRRSLGLPELWGKVHPRFSKMKDYGGKSGTVVPITILIVINNINKFVFVIIKHWCSAYIFIYFKEKKTSFLCVFSYCTSMDLKSKFLKVKLFDDYSKWLTWDMLLFLTWNEIYLADLACWLNVKDGL